MESSNTNASEITKERFFAAIEQIKGLQEWLEHIRVFIEKQIERAKTEGAEIDALPAGWCSIMMEKALGVFNENAKANGAILIRDKGKDKDKIKVGSPFHGPIAS